MMRYRFSAVLLIAGVTVFHLWYIASGRIDLAPDEAHYWEWSRRLDWSYYSKGPMVAYLIAVSTRLGGSTEFFVRLPAVLLALGTVIIIYSLTRALLASERAAFLAIVIAAFIPLFSAGSVLMTIDAPLMFFWAVGILAFWEANQSRDVRRGGRGWWILLGLALGLGLLSKYTMALFVPCALLYLVFFSNPPAPLRWREIYVAVLIAGILFTPVLIWNAQHQWVSLRHVVGQAGLSGDAHLSARTFLQFLGSQAGVISPFLLPALAAAILQCQRLRVTAMREQSLFLVVFSAPVLLFFLSWSVYSKVEANWAAPGYLTAVIALAAWWDSILGEKRSTSKRRSLALFSVLLLPGAFLVLIAHFPAALNLVGIDLPPRLDPTRRLHGWKELGSAVGELLEGSEKRNLFLLSDTYQIASEMAFYVPGQPQTYNVNLGRRMNQYDLWAGIEQLRGRDGLFVTNGDFIAPPAIEKACMALRKLKTVTPIHRGRPAQVFSIFGCDGYRGVAEDGREVSY